MKSNYLYSAIYKKVVTFLFYYFEFSKEDKRDISFSSYLFAMYDIFLGIIYA